MAKSKRSTKAAAPGKAPKSEAVERTAPPPSAGRPVDHNDHIEAVWKLLAILVGAENVLVTDERYDKSDAIQMAARLIQIAQRDARHLIDALDAEVMEGA